MKIGIACDHGAFEAKEIIKEYLIKEGHEVTDYGTYSNASCDYPDFAYACAESVSEKKNERGIVICGTGIGVSITANKVKGIRCALCSEATSARLTREHNDSNMLAMGQRTTGIEVMKDIVRTWIHTDYSHDERHQRRIDKITQIEQK